MDPTVQALREHREHAATKRPGDVRREFERDYGRLIHTPGFRRLQGKSQLFAAGSGDYYRTRLTHSLEVAQLARHAAEKLVHDHPALTEAPSPGLALDTVVVECAALAHDLGHPPFGHRGESELDNLLQRRGYRFEGNAQTFRLITFLEKRIEGSSYNNIMPSDGLNLTDAVLLATNKYPYTFGPEGPDERATIEQASGAGTLLHKGLYLSEWSYIEERRHAWQIPADHRTLEAQLMDLCDDIAYSAHDLEDGIRAGKIDLSPLDENDPGHRSLAKQLVKEVQQDQLAHPDVWPPDTNLETRVAESLKMLHNRWDAIRRACRGDSSRTRRELKAQLVNLFIGALGALDTPDKQWKKITLVRDGVEDLPLRQHMVVLKKLAWVRMVKDARVQRLQLRSARMIQGLWRALYRDWQNQLPADWLRRYDALNSGRMVWPLPRFVADYIAGFTDSYAEEVYNELYGGRRPRSIYELE